MKKGFKDSIYGTFKIYQMDRDQQKIKESQSSPHKQEQMSTLARRRAERMKQKEVKNSEWVLKIEKNQRFGVIAVELKVLRMRWRFWGGIGVENQFWGEVGVESQFWVCSQLKAGL